MTRPAVLSLGMDDLVEWLRESQRIRRFDWQDEAILADVARDAEGVADSIAAFVAHLRSADPALPVVLHGYDRFPLDRGGGIFSRYASGLPEPLRQQVINTYVDGLNERLAAVFKDDEKTAFCDLRGTIPEDGWYDEAHPNNGGFAIVSERLQAALERLTAA